MREGKMSNYEARVIKYCRERILPWDYSTKINKELKECRDEFERYIEEGEGYGGENIAFR